MSDCESDQEDMYNDLSLKCLLCSIHREISVLFHRLPYLCGYPFCTVIYLLRVRGAGAGAGSNASSSEISSSLISTALLCVPLF